MELFTAALDTVVLDPDATAQDRYGLLMELAEVHRWTGDWLSLIAVVEAAIGVADEIGDIRLLAQAGCGLTRGRRGSRPGTAASTTSWSTPCAAASAGFPKRTPSCAAGCCSPCRPSSTTGSGTRSARRWPTLGCRWLVGSVTPSCSCTPARSGSSARRPSTAPARVAIAEEGVRLSRELGHERSYVACLTLLAVALGELGQRDRQREALALGFPEARRLHLPYALLVLETMDIPWLAMAGRIDEVDAALARVVEVTSTMRLPQAEDGITGAIGALLLWSDRADELAELLKGTEEGPLPVAAALHAAIWCRIRRTEDARAVLDARGPLDLSADNWFSMLVWGPACEAAAGTDDRDLASRAYERLAPYPEHAVTGGSGLADGLLRRRPSSPWPPGRWARPTSPPVTPTRAEALCAEWGIPLCGRWLQEQRERYGF